MGIEIPGNTRNNAEGLCWHSLDLTITFKIPWDYWVRWDQPELMGLSLGGEGALGESRPVSWGHYWAVPSVPGLSQLWHLGLGLGFPALNRLCTAPGRFCAMCDCPAWHLPSLSWAVCCAWLRLFAVTDVCCGLGPGVRARGGVAARQNSTLQPPSVPLAHRDVIFVPCPSCKLLAFRAGSFCFQKERSAHSAAAAALQDKNAR